MNRSTKVRGTVLDAEVDEALIRCLDQAKADSRCDISVSSMIKSMITEVLTARGYLKNNKAV